MDKEEIKSRIASLERENASLRAQVEDVRQSKEMWHTIANERSAEIVRLMGVSSMLQEVLKPLLEKEKVNERKRDVDL